MWLSRRSDELAAALMLLTRLPAWPVRDHDEDITARAVWAYPLVGGVVGAIGGAIYVAVCWIGLSPKVCACVALAATVLATGCFHEDGLADFCDGVGGGHTRERKLEIMRDSRIGTYGAAALILSFGLRAGSLATLDPRWVIAVWIVSGALARAAALLLLAVLPPARADGLAQTAAAPPAFSLAAGWSIASLAALTALALPGLSLVAAALAGGVVVLLLSRRYLGGYTGDALGAATQAAEIACLITATTLWAMP